MPQRLPRMGLVLAACVVGAAAAAASAQSPERTAPKVVVLGFDGLDATRVERLMAEGRLPALARLRDGGGYARLRPSNPAQSPVSWASITTGWNPGKTGIYDFLRRVDMDPRKIDLAHAEAQATDPMPWWARVGALAAAGLLGAVTAGALAFAASRKWPSFRRGRPFEGALTGGAALFACAGFVAVEWVPESVKEPRNLRSGEPFWVTLDRGGFRAVALEGPLCFPPEPMDHGCCLAGLGVPDMAATWGTFAVWSDDLTLPGKTEMGSTTYYVGGGAERFDVLVGGPPDPFLDAAGKSKIHAAEKAEARRRSLAGEWTRQQRRESETAEAKQHLRYQLVATLPVELRRGEGATVTLQDGTRVELVPGRWTDLLPVTFRANPAVQPQGRLRLLLEDAGAPAAGNAPPKPFRLFVGQVQWDLARLPPNVRLTSPRSFAGDLAASGGPTESIGWPEQTNPVKEDVLSDQAFLDHTYLLMGLRERRLQAQLARGDFDLLFAMFSEPDRVQHALYRHVDPECPTHDPEEAKRFAPEVDRIYVEADRIVAQTIAAAPKDAVVLVVSDHGFAPFRRGVNLNNFLVAKGWQAREGMSGPRGIEGLGKSNDFFKDVDWSRTKAYAMGLGNVFLNVAGREPAGIVPLDQADALAEQIAKELEALTDADGARVVRKVYLGRDLYRGGRVPEAPDLVVGFEWGYRVSWQTGLGATDADVITPNTFRWSGDHCSVDPELVPAVVFSTRPLRTDAAPKVEDVAPSVLSLYGLAPADPDGASFFR